jgi:drug/metabolite transporter (DMT)-like permease
VVLLLSLGSAVTYGLSDFVGGLATRRASVWIIAATSQGIATLVTFALVATNPGRFETADLLWAVLAGLGSGAGNVLIYQGLAAGRMSVVAPLAAIATAAIPVIVGLATGDRPGPLPVAGVLLALPAVWLVSDPRTVMQRVGRADLMFGLAAGLGFGVQFSALGQIPAHAGLTPLAASQLVSILSIIVAAAVIRAPWIPRDRSARLGALAGVLAGLATVCFQLAVQRGMLTIAGVVASLYPATTVLLSYFVLRERMHLIQGAGLGLAATAVALIASG